MGIMQMRYLLPHIVQKEAARLQDLVVTTLFRMQSAPNYHNASGGTHQLNLQGSILQIQCTVLLLQLLQSKGHDIVRP